MNILIKQVNSFLSSSGPCLMFVIMDSEDYLSWNKEASQLPWVGATTRLDEEFNGTATETLQYISLLAKVQTIKGENVSKNVALFIHSHKQDDQTRFKHSFHDLLPEFEDTDGGSFAFVQLPEVDEKYIIDNFPDLLAI